MKPSVFLWSLIVIALCIGAQASDNVVTVVAPDQPIQCVISLESAQPHWAIAYQDKPILLSSPLGFELKEDADFCKNLRVINVANTTVDSTWKPVYGERSEIPDKYNESHITFAKKGSDRAQLILTLRVYNEGVAIRYTLPETAGLDTFKISEEHTTFRLSDDHRAWPVYAAQAEYAPSSLSQIKENCERPLTLEINNGPTIAIGEAALVDYARMRLRPVEGAPYTLESHLAGYVKGSAPFDSPWRVVMIAESPGKLLEQNYLLLNLNEPCAIEDTSWIKPGKVIREVTLTTDGGKACVDFAVAQNIQYIEFDAGWYGNEYDPKQDATTVTVDPKRSKGPLALQEVIDYGKEKGIGVLLYVNRRHLEKQLDELLPLFQSWGIKGVKYGFVQVGSQKWTRWMHEAVRKAADHKLLIDVHDEYRPTGYSRTYPNFLTQEGICGNEEMPPAEHNAALPFTRYLCGAGDYTICWYSNRVKNTLAHQLAASVCFYSPFQFVYWYDRPAAFQGDPGATFLKEVPVTWDALHVIHDKIGAYATLARKKDEAWFVGALNAQKERRLEIPLDFLDKDRSYTATLYADASPAGEDRTGVKVSSQTVTASDSISAHMAHNGGLAIQLSPLSK